MIYLTTDEVIRLQAWIIQQSGGRPGILDRGKIDSAVELPKAGFGGQEFYPTLAEKAAAIGFSLACNYGSVDGNKRIGHAALETFLVLNGHELTAGVDEQEDVFLRLADHKMARDEFTDWVRRYVTPVA
ncbi:MAG: type II toxin-antitoxin system death-on-curing family toxin [Gemmataceae bacterium]|nr:type II toxin-antitoxin system death-on-curing family toxin [Gemmataceae bacterium]